jgi:high-affinity iron transporter
VGESFLIALREGFEAALIVAIVLAFVRRRAPEQAAAVWLGTAAALVISAVVGVILHIALDGLEGQARLRTFGVICLAAAGLLTWMIFWMRAHARSLKGELENRAGSAIAQGSAVGLALVAFVAVLREGLETALFLISATSAANGGQVVAGTLLGLAVAAGLGVAVYFGSGLINLRLFFQVTGVLIILFAAGLVARAVLFFQSAGDIGTLNNAVYDLTGQAWLTLDTQSGRFLAGIFGWDPRPSIEQVIAYLAYLIPVTWFFFSPGRSSAPASPPPSSDDADGRAPLEDAHAPLDGVDLDEVPVGDR